MLREMKKLALLSKLTIALTLTVMVLLVSVSIASAVLFTIDTNNNSWLDWQNVPLFLSDPTGDVSTSCAGGTANDDIVSVYVASGPPGGTPTDIYFRVVVAGTNAVSVQAHQISAYMDCPPAGQDNHDANVIYRGFPDQTVLGNGVLPNPDVKIYAAGGPEGERPANALNSVEWTGIFADMASFTAGGPLNCTPNTVATIRVETFLVNSTTGLFSCAYDDTAWRSFDTPTAVKLQSVSATSSKNWLTISAATLAAALLIGVAGFVFVNRKKV